MKSGFLACFEDENGLTKRTILDFANSYIDLEKSTFLTKLDKEILVEGAIKLLEKKDLSITRRVYK